MAKFDIIAATGCPTGIAHTFMAKEALEKAAAERGLTIKVETHGQVGVENELTKSEIAGAKAVVVPPDTEHFQIPMEALEKAITPNTRAIIVNSPNNPSGVVYSKETFEKVNALLTKKSEEIGHAIYIIADEP